MKFVEPSQRGYTIYTKSGCTYCDMVKLLLDDEDIFYSVVNCDDYLKDDREKFLNFIAILAGKPYKTFPMVFYDDKFLGGFSETRAALFASIR